MLPASAYKLLRTGQSSNPHPFVLTPRTGVRTSQQVQQHHLCGECEQRFSRRGEAWVMANCWRGVNKFAIQDILVKSEPILANAELKIYAGASLPGIEMAKLVYFAASVFWRASTRQWRILGSRIHIALGPYAEPLRLFLIDAAPFPLEMVLNIVVSGLTNHTLDVGLFPKSSRTKIGIRRHRFIIPEMYFTLLVGNQITDAERLICAAHTSEGRSASGSKQISNYSPAP